MKSSRDKTNFTLIFSAEAQLDIRDILQYTYESWGLKQAEKYEAKIEKGLETMLANPSIGRKKDDYFKGCRVFHVERHLVFYIIKEKAVHVVRMLNQDMDVEKLL